LLKRVQLTISGCVGPCDVPNVVVITTSSGTEWLGNIVRFDQYRSLLEWAVRCRDAGRMLALPREFDESRISPFYSRTVSWSANCMQEEKPSGVELSDVLGAPRRGAKVTLARRITFGAAPLLRFAPKLHSQRRHPVPERI